MRLCVCVAGEQIRKRRCKAAFSYLPQHEDELELKAGDVIEILAEVRPVPQKLASPDVWGKKSFSVGMCGGGKGKRGPSPRTNGYATDNSS